MDPLEAMRARWAEQTKCERLLGKLGRRLDDVRLEARFVRHAAPAVVADVAAAVVVVGQVWLEASNAPVRFGRDLVGQAGVRLYRPNGLGWWVLKNEEWAP